jgi:hypothetical protein
MLYRPSCQTRQATCRLTSKKRRTATKASSACCREQETRQLQQFEQSFIDSDNISTLSLSEVADKLRSESVPTGFTVTVVGESLLIYVLDIQTDVAKIPACIRVAKDFTVIVTLHDKVDPPSQYSDLLKKTLKLLSHVVNLMARLRSWLTDSGMKILSFKNRSGIHATGRMSGNTGRRQ